MTKFIFRSHIQASIHHLSLKVLTSTSLCRKRHLICVMAVHRAEQQSFSCQETEKLSVESLYLFIFLLKSVFKFFIEKNPQSFDHYIKHLIRTRGEDFCKTSTNTNFHLLICPSAKAFFLDYCYFNSKPYCRILLKINLCSPRLVLLLCSLETVFPSNQHPCTGSTCTFFTVS